MLKKICRLLLLGIVVCAGSACVTPTHASSALYLPSTSAHSVIITHIYPGTADGAIHELVALYNTTDEPVDITSWCIVNKNILALTCFQNEHKERYFIAARSTVVVVSSEYAALHGTSAEHEHSSDSENLDSELPATALDRVYAVANRTSGSLVGSNDTVQLRDSFGRVVDEWSWSASLSKGSGFIRTGLNEESGEYEASSSFASAPIEQVFGGGLYTEIDPNNTYDPDADDPGSGDTVGSDSSEPGRGGAGADTSQEGLEDILVVAPVYINEIIPNPVGADAGNEFIELYNPLDSPVVLSEYRLRVSGGASSKTYVFPENLTVEPFGYAVVENSTPRFSLNNTAGVVAVTYATGAEPYTVDEVSYSDPKEGYSWARFIEVAPDTSSLSATPEWKYTSTPTPGAENIFTVHEEPVLATEKKPCNPDQFRNPLTGRCKKNPVTSTPTPCKAGQYRSSETNRCRNIALAKVPAPCKVGQERNPETNRCRNIKKMSVAGHAVESSEVKEKPGGLAWYAWVVVGSIVLGVIGYAIWEWREEVSAVAVRVKGVVGGVIKRR